MDIHKEIAAEVGYLAENDTMSVGDFIDALTQHLEHNEVSVEYVVKEGRVHPEAVAEMQKKVYVYCKSENRWITNVLMSEEDGNIYILVD